MCSSFPQSPPLSVVSPHMEAGGLQPWLGWGIGLFPSVRAWRLSALEPENLALDRSSCWRPPLTFQDPHEGLGQVLPSGVWWGSLNPAQPEGSSYAL